MHPPLLKQHIEKIQQATTRPFGVNIPLLYPEIGKIIQVVIEQDVKIVFTSAGNPTTWTQVLKENGITVVHVVSSVKFARKAEQAGVDAVVAEGFEAGGHNGREETTTMVLIPMVREAISIPLIAAGGIASGRAMLAAEALGADGVQIGSRFAASQESSAHQNFKNRIITSSEGETMLTLKQLTPVRLMRNEFFQQVIEAEKNCASIDDLVKLLGTKRSKRGMFEGELNEGELEIGQVAAAIRKVQPASEIINEIWDEYCSLKKKLSQ
jgi:enoyl-[acyl-carrier protein] reductase II